MSDVTNQYIAARREWDERYGSTLSRARNWMLVAFFCAVAAIVSTAGNVWQATRSHVVPFVIALDGDRPVALGRAEQLNTTNDKRVVRAALFAWLQDFRMVTNDPQAMRLAIDRVYVHIAKGSQAQEVVSDFYRKLSPFQRAQGETVAIEVKVVLPTSEHTYEMEWIETARDLYGTVKVQERYRGSFQTALEPPEDEKLARLNPMGVYVVQANWTKVL